MTRLAQSARVLEAVQQPAQDVADMLDTFRSQWAKHRQWGYIKPALPPISNQHKAEAFANAHAHFWSGAFVPFGDYERLLADTKDAILAANVQWAALRGKKAGGSPALRQRLMERDGDKCWLCGHELGDDATIEHKEPLANGGTWAIGNLALAHSGCNHALGRLPVAAKEAARSALIEARREPLKTMEDEHGTH